MVRILDRLPYKVGRCLAHREVGNAVSSLSRAGSVTHAPGTQVQVKEVLDPHKPLPLNLGAEVYSAVWLFRKG